ncbi:S8 family serine peptidase [Lentilactobacillus sp. Marseille-Q4993]|uniref:S8 family serine peptidase n=1 Tax=Lentilactobacillus sp. Marseille-Q4993 TaxID=3039492 RepID=UPI0024BCBF4C|nr:S8 family serine peptidase [Lentilactobacillus sp. Marseille-Q4993]
MLKNNGCPQSRHFLPNMGWITISVITGVGILFGEPSVISTKAAITSELSTNSILKTSKKTNANQASLTKGNVSALWKQGYSGQGMVVAVIDSGVQPHKDLRLTNAASGKISKADASSMIAKKGYGKYINSKIPFSYDYVNNDNDTGAPDDVSSYHGQHVAGIATANGKTSSKKYVKGVAPEAQILDMKVFGGFADENPHDVARAIHDAVDLGANVINMSLGIGAASQSLTDEEQAAVKYATDHGVFVATAAGNDGHAASIFTTDMGVPGTISKYYEPKTSGNISNPAVAESAVTVASEKTNSGKSEDMSSYSSWGPTPDFTLKPDVTAPGEDIVSTWKNNTYETDSGTSMATPFISGTAALIMQRLAKEQPDLQGADLVLAVKNAMMNSAVPMNDILSRKNIISPRRQGAGKINVTNAANLKASLVDLYTGLASESLKQIGNQKNFTLKLTNKSNETQTYKINPSKVYTEKTSKVNDSSAYDSPIKGAGLQSSSRTVSVNPGESKNLQFSLKLNGKLKRNNLAEGFVRLINKDSKQNLTVPYLGYYGDLTTEKVIDKPANQKGSAFKGGYLVDEHNTPLGITDAKSLAHIVNNPSHRLSWSSLGNKVMNSKVAFSPNGDGVSDEVSPYVFAKQNLKSAKMEVIDSSGNVVRVIDKENNLQRSFYQDGDSWNDDLSLSPSMRLNPNRFRWNGKVFDQSKDAYVVAKDGNYSYRIITNNYNSGANKQQSFSLPFKIDTAKPNVKVSYSNGNLRVSYFDQGVGFSKYSYAVIDTPKKQFSLKLHSNASDNSGVRTVKLSKEALRYIKAGGSKSAVEITDLAGNTTTRKIGISSGTKSNSKLTTKQVAPQFQWLRMGKSKSKKNGALVKLPHADRNMWKVLVPKSGTIKYVAKVPKNAGITAYARDEFSGKRYMGKVNPKKGIATFSVKVEKGIPVLLKGFASITTKKFGDTLQSPANYLSINTSKSKDAIAPNKWVQKEKINLLTNAAALKQSIQRGTAADLPGHATKDLTTRFAETKGIKFAELNDNNLTVINSYAKFYNSETKELTISGKVSNPKAKLQIFKSPNENDPDNQVTIDGDGHFSFKVPVNSTDEKGIGYKLVVPGSKKETTSRGTLLVKVDTKKPTLKLDNDNSQIKTSRSSYTISGTVDDNVDGYRLSINGNNIFHQQNNSGFVNNTDASKQPNPYQPVTFSNTYNLNKGDNYFNVTVIDQTGNRVSKKIDVVRQ